jgi:hypothetical protein
MSSKSSTLEIYYWRSLEFIAFVRGLILMLDERLFRRGAYFLFAFGHFRTD